MILSLVLNFHFHKIETKKEENIASKQLAFQGKAYVGVRVGTGTGTGTGTDTGTGTSTSTSTGTGRGDSAQVFDNANQSLLVGPRS